MDSPVSSSSLSSGKKTDLEAAQGHPPTIESSSNLQLSEPDIEEGCNFRPQAVMEEKCEQNDANGTNDDVRKITGFRWALICAALYLSALMYGLDTTIAADVQGAVIETFSEVSQLSWIGAGFPLGSVAVILPYGFLYTTFNMKWLYIAGIVLFQAGSAL